LFFVWANLHGAVALGGAVLAAATVTAWFTDRPRFARLAGITLLSAALTAVTPMGAGLWRFIGESMARSHQNQVMEWLPSTPKGPVEIAFWVAVVILVGLLVRRWRRLASWDDRVVVAAALILLPLAARSVRNIPPFFLLWMPAVSRLIGPDARLSARWPFARKTAPAAKRTDVEHPRLNLLLAGVAAAGAIGAVALCWALPLERLGWRPIAPAAVAAIRACPGRLYNRYNEGGFLIWFAPDVPVFVDSRQDPYPDDFLTADVIAEKTGDVRALFARYQIGCATLPPKSPIEKTLRAEGWQEAYRDPTWLVFYPPRPPRPPLPVSPPASPPASPPHLR
jgi:hypothetical protein